MENRERFWVIKDIVCFALVFLMMTFLMGLMVKMAGGIPQLFAVAKEGDVSVVFYIDIIGYFLVLALTIFVPIRTYNKLKVGRTALLAYAETNRWQTLEFIETMRKNDKYYVVVGENVPPLIFNEPVIAGTYEKPLERRFLFYRNDKYLLVKDKVFDDRYYLFIV